MKVEELLNEYYLSFEYNNLRQETKVQYKYFLGIVSSTSVVDGKELGSYKLSSLTTKLAKLSYNKWCERGVSFANHLMSVVRVLLNYGINMEHCNMNPFSNIKKRVTKSRKVVWTKEDVIRFLDTCYSDFNTRSIGLIAHMAYEWCQRIGDMRLLEWSNLDLDAKRMQIEQSKRRAQVFLPISDELHEMLVQQQNDYGFQKYVAPRPRAYKGSYKPYSLTKLPLLARKAMDSAGLSKELRLSDLRRTGTVEMVDAGVSMGNIMSVTGHANPQSVKPYMKNTFTSANLALQARKNLTHEKSYGTSMLSADKEGFI
jgi:integrase